MWEGVDLLLRTVVRTNLTEVRESSGRSAESFGLIAYPNPFRDTLFLRVAGENYRPGEILVYDLLGREIPVVLRASGNGLFWNGRDAKSRPLPRGVYFLKLREGRRVSVVRVLKY